MHEKLIDKIKAVTNVSEDDILKITTAFQPQKFAKSGFLHNNGEVAHDIFFIVSGVAHQFYADEKGLCHTCFFAFENDFIADLDSFSRQTPSQTSIQALAPVDCLAIRCTEVVRLMEEMPAFGVFMRYLMEKVALQNIQRTKTLLSLNPEKRFEEMMEQQPHVFLRIPQKYIAQYLGITPESMSRIKKRLFTESKT